MSPVTEASAEGLKETISTGLDTVAMLALAGGVGWALWPSLGPWAITAGGGALVLLNAASSWLRRPKVITVPDQTVILDDQPGPEHPGTLHVVGR